MFCVNSFFNIYYNHCCYYYYLCFVLEDPSQWDVSSQRLNPLIAFCNKCYGLVFIQVKKH